ncbi:Protein toll [Halotydeus destructor]|nr:Protein toll [Halotydeus destructor]
MKNTTSKANSMAAIEENVFLRLQMSSDRATCLREGTPSDHCCEMSNSRQRRRTMCSSSAKKRRRTISPASQFTTMAWSTLIYCLLTALAIVRVADCAQYVAPGQCTWTHSSSSDFDVALDCTVRTINSNGLNFSLIQSEHTATVNVVCDDNLLESRLAGSSFAHLRTLKSLALVNCRLPAIGHTALSGLQSLRNLTLRTFTPGPGLILSPVALESQRQTLEYLDLGFNLMSELPADMFCPLTNLKVLNLTRNQLTGFGSLGVVDHTTGHLCLQELQELDLSYNRITFLSETGVASLKNLRALYLHHNQINQVAELSLSALSRLTVIDLSHNQLTNLPARSFRELSELRQLYLQNNSIVQLPTELFAGLSKLYTLDLSYNEISSDSLTSDTFADLIRVVILDMGHNRLKVINGSIFQSQYSLQVVNLNDNEIERILDHSFSSLYNLDTLVLARNRLKQVDLFTLNGLYVLKKLLLDENEIHTVHESAFANCTTLTELSLDGNLLTEVPKAIGSLKRLKTLRLRDNALLDIKNAPYLGLQHLDTLNLSLNKVVNLSRGSLTDLPSLKRFDLSGNRVRALDHGVFDDAPGLQAIHLENNLLTDINGLFMNLAELRLLNVSRNRITWFDYALVPKSVERLDLHSNKIEDLGNYFEVGAQLQLTWLDISGNVLKTLGINTLPDKIEHFNAAHNLISVIQQFAFKNKPSLRHVDLTNNSLSTLDMNSLQLEEIYSGQDVPEFYISKNPYYCDCNMEWLQRINENQGPYAGRLPRIVDLASVTCTLPFGRDNALAAIMDVNPANFLCKYKSHCFALCHCCDFDACDCEMMCPENCTCYYDQTWNANLVDCSASKHSVVPPRIPMDVTELYLDGNNISSLSSHTFIGRKNLKVLHLNNSNIETISNWTFNGLKSLQVMNLNHNRLTVLHGYEFERLVDLKELYLSYNRIATLANNSFSALRSLRVLHLDHNYIIEFQVWNLNVNSQLRDLKLAHNTWSCECDFAGEFVEWLHRKRFHVSDEQMIQCYYNETTGLTLINEFNRSSCTYYPPPNKVLKLDLDLLVTEKFQVHELVPVVAAGAALLTLVLISLILLLVYRREMSLWFYSRYGVRLRGRNNSRREEEKLFDAFVSYSKKDEAFVSQILAPELEYGSPPFRLCLHYRDLPVASGYLSDAIVQAMEASRRSVLVISEHFLKSEWCRYEFKSAHLDVLRSNPNHKLILIFICNVNSKDLDPDIRFMLKTQTILQWGEKMFWEKLKYAMPDITFARKPPACLEQPRGMTMAVNV